MVKYNKSIIINKEHLQIKYQHIKDGQYLKKSTYLIYPNKYLFDSLLFDENNNIIDYKIYYNNKIHKHFKMTKSGYLKIIKQNKQNIDLSKKYFYKLKDITKNNDDYFYIKCYEKINNSKYIKAFTDIYKNNGLYRMKMYDLNEKLIKDEIIKN